MQGTVLLSQANDALTVSFCERFDAKCIHSSRGFSRLRLGGRVDSLQQLFYVVLKFDGQKAKARIDGFFTKKCNDHLW